MSGVVRDPTGAILHGEVRVWPTCVGGEMDGKPVPESWDWRHSRAPYAQEAIRATTETYSDMKVELVPQELAVRFLCVDGESDYERFKMCCRKIAEAAFDVRATPS